MMNETASSLFDEILADHIDLAERVRPLAPLVAAIAAEICQTFRRGDKVLICGNGGSAADSQHLATELAIRFESDRAALPAIALTTDTSALTAAANDLGVAQMFARQVEALGEEGDLLLGITTSGNSMNVLTAFKVARERKLRTVCLTGGDGGRAKELVDICLAVPSKNTARVQEMHILIGHAICAAVDRAFG